MKSRSLAIFILTFLAWISSPQAARATIILIANEKATSGTSIYALNTTTHILSTYFTGLAHTDGLAYGPDGLLYATSFDGGTLNRITSSNTNTQIASGFNGSGALAVDVGGNFYVPNFGAPSGGGTVMSKVSPDGGGGYTNTLNFSTGLSTPDGVAFDSLGNLYEADFGSGRINRINTTSGAVTTVVTGLSQPSAIVFDSSDNLYVTSFNTGGVSKISNLSGTPTVNNSFATGLSSPLGLLLDPSSNIFYATSWNSNTISTFGLGGGAASAFNITSGGPLNGPTHMVILLPEPSRMILLMFSFMAIMLRRKRSSAC